MSFAITPAQGAVIAACAEAMFDPAQPLRATLDARLRDNLRIVGLLIAKNALFSAQGVGVGDPVYFGFVAQSLMSSDDYVVAIRGTEQPIEWLEDAEAFFVPHPSGGLVEQGFWSIYRSMTFTPLAPTPVVSTAARGIIGLLNIDARVTFIGHSLGAPLATYLAMDTVAVLGAGHVQALLYASPKPGDGTFGHAFDTAIGHENYLVANYLRDVVPRLPLGLPFGLGFQSLPNVTWLKPSQARTPIADNIVSNHNCMNYAALLGYEAAKKSTSGVEV